MGPDMSQAQAPLIAGPQPGSIWIEALQEWVDAKSWVDGVIYDTEIVVTPFAAGNTLNFFRNLAFQATGVAKDARHTNMVTPSQLPSGWYAKVWGLSVRVLQLETALGSGLFTTPEDVQRALYEMVFRFTTGNQKIERDLPALMWPSPYGMSAEVMRTGGAWTTWSSVNNGVPAAGAMYELTFPIELVNELTFQGVLSAPGGLQLDNNIQVMMELHCIQSMPLR
jgi:hypothetical protein